MESRLVNRNISYAVEELSQGWNTDQAKLRFFSPSSVFHPCPSEAQFFLMLVNGAGPGLTGMDGLGQAR